MVEFTNSAGDKLGEMTLDGDDCLAWTSFRLESKAVDFAEENDTAAELDLIDRDGARAGKLKVFFGHRPETPPAKNAD